MYAAVGYHPENLTICQIDYLSRLAKLCEHKKVAAIGEIGLDYHWDIDRDLQKKIFIQQLELAESLKMPVVIHNREAHGDTLEILKKYRPNALVHCFSGSVEMMREVVKLGMCISLGGVGNV